MKTDSPKSFFGTHSALSPGYRNAQRRAKSVFASFLFQPLNGLANSAIPATEKSRKMDVVEALDLSEKLVCTYSIVPSRPNLGPPPSSLTTGEFN